MNRWTLGAAASVVTPGLMTIALGLLSLFTTRGKLFPKPGLELIVMGSAVLPLSLWITSTPGMAAVATAQMACGLLVLLGFARLSSSGSTDGRHVALGVLVGTTVLATISILYIVRIPGLSNLLPGETGADRVAGWLAHPNMWGVVPLVAALFLFSLGNQYRLAWLNLVPASVIVLASGSRTAALALAGPVLVFMVLRTSPRLRLLVLVGLPVLAAMLSFSSVSQNTWLSRFDPFARAYPERNLLIASEDLDFGAWSKIGVTAKADRVARLVGLPKVAWTVTKTTSDWWSRVAQSVSLEPGATYFWRSEIRSLTSEAVPGFHGIGRGSEYAFLNAYTNNGEWQVETEGRIENVTIKTVDLSDGWTRVELGFRFSGQSPISFQIGPTPDQRRTASGAAIQVRGMQWVKGGLPNDYYPTQAKGVDSRASLGTLGDRIFYFESAIEGWLERPLFGWGSNEFAQYVRNHPSPFNYSVAHAHNLLAGTLFSRGLVGLTGLLLLLVGLARMGRAGGSVALLPLLGVLIVSTLDLTFWSSAVYFPLMAITGWHAGSDMVITLRRGEHGELGSDDE